MYKVPEEWKLSDFLELSNDEKLKWLYNGVKNGGGGGGESNIFEIVFTPDSYDEPVGVTCNKTFSELMEAYEAGKTILAVIKYPESFVNPSTYYANSMTVYTTGGVQNRAVVFNFAKYAGYNADYTYSYSIWFMAEELSLSIATFCTPSITPVVFPDLYDDGDTLDYDVYEVISTCVDNNLPFIMTVATNDYTGTFYCYNNSSAGYSSYTCFAGDSEMIGATLSISDSGELTVTLPNQ